MWSLQISRGEGGDFVEKRTNEGTKRRRSDALTTGYPSTVISRPYTLPPVQRLPSRLHGTITTGLMHVHPAGHERLTARWTVKAPIRATGFNFSGPKEGRLP